MNRGAVSPSWSCRLETPSLQNYLYLSKECIEQSVIIFVLLQEPSDDRKPIFMSVAMKTRAGADQSHVAMYLRRYMTQIKAQDE